jgi:hypothetical protein
VSPVKYELGTDCAAGMAIERWGGYVMAVSRKVWIRKEAVATE